MTDHAFGMSKAWTVTVVTSLLRTVASLSLLVIRFPASQAAWDEMQRAFENKQGVSGVCGVIDGTLFAISRPNKYDSWYCRKRYPAVNMQAVVDHSKRFMGFDMAR